MAAVEIVQICEFLADFDLNSDLKVADPIFMQEIAFG